MFLKEAVELSGPSSSEIRKKFLEYFRQRDHEVVPSSSLVPAGDPTLLFTNAGMVQFKDVFLGRESRSRRRAVTAQRCLRVSGKHNDLEEVGKTARHCTFFEMLGNFSFGDYFKEDAIAYAWELLTRGYGLDAADLWVTVYRDDEEAARLWQRVAGLSADRIVPLGEEDNFWSMGETGPCGPCSEIVVDRGPRHSCGAANCRLDTCGCDRWLELWNLVFMQYERDESGQVTPLPRPCIDTGMGLERLATLLQGADSIFGTDLLAPLIRATEELSGRAYDPGPDGMPFRVIADHLRASVFLVMDGVVPSNEGRGYVFRRILRRALRFATLLGMELPVLYRLVPVAVRVYEDAYPGLVAMTDQVVQVVRWEEERFRTTVREGSQRALEAIQEAKARGLRRLPGKVAFTLYDTFGFPIDLTQDMAREHGLEVDREGFERALEEQRRRARAARAEQEDEMGLLAGLLEGERPTEFVGYERLQVSATVVALVKEGEGTVARLCDGEEGWVVTDRTPFYPEGGGQLADRGEMRSGALRLVVGDVRRLPSGVIVHRGRMQGGDLRVGQEVVSKVDPEWREGAQRHHTATHLLHRVLKETLGEHVNQSGSLVAPDRLRFDFTHFASLTAEQLREIEERVNRLVWADLEVRDCWMSMEEARRAGAIALFGEKYGERVRVVSIGDVSKELCGGTHVNRTGQVGPVLIIQESSVGAGLRRVEAVVGPAAWRHWSRMRSTLERAAELLKSSWERVPAKVEQLQQNLEEREKRLATLQREAAMGALQGLLQSAKVIGGITLVYGEIPASDPRILRELADVARSRLQDGLVVLGSAGDDRVMLVAMATQGAVGRGIHAGRLLGRLAKLVDGGGGGRPDMAEAGGRSPRKLAGALQRLPQLVEELVKEGHEGRR